jgi:lipopolysaccharide/colanic/teichoic acid biosynthesis glycosyltransferase
MDFFIKRLMDVTVAATLLLLASPLLVLLMLLVRARLGAPIFFRQARIGMGERPFTLIKFRTMLAGDAPDDQRLTPFGQWLRATSLDELPELWNILIGEMSLVGPRPLLPRYLPYYTAREATRHRMRPGITGLAQVSGRNALTWDARLELDAQYVEQFSFARDLRILWRTVAVVLNREGVSREGHVTMHALDEERKALGKP